MGMLNINTINSEYFNKTHFTGSYSLSIQGKFGCC